MFKFYPKAFSVLCFLGISCVLFSQNVGINTTASTPSPNAILDLNTGNQRNMGLIIPSVSLGTSLTYFQSPNGPMPGNPTASDNGMIVYNTGANQPVGYYYWNGNALPNPTWVSTGGGAIGATINACGAAASGYIPYYTSPTNICNSVIYQLSTTAVGVGTLTPKNMLDVNGAMAIGSYAGTVTAPANGMVVSGQMAIGTNTPPASAALDINSTTQGFLPPNITTAQIAAISNPANGLMVYNTTTDCMEYYSTSAAQWVNVSCQCGTIQVDNVVTATANTTTLNIATAYPNEVVLVMNNGYKAANASYTGGVPTVTGGSASAVTLLINTQNYDASYIYSVNTAIYGFIANTAASYTVTFTSETGNTDYNVSAVALYGFCTAPTIAANVITGTATKFASTNVNTNLAGSLTNSTVTPTKVNSYAVANYYNLMADIPPDVVSWSSPAGAIPLLTDDNFIANEADGSIAGYADPNTALITYTVQDLYDGVSGANDIFIGTLQVVDVHN